MYRFFRFNIHRIKRNKKEDFKFVLLKEDINYKNFDIYVLEDITIGDDSDAPLNYIYNNLQYNKIDRRHSMIKKPTLLVMRMQNY